MLIALLLIPLMIYINSTAVDKSRYTQAHGVSDLGTVTSVSNGRGTTSVAVTLATPVDGATTTTVNIPGHASYSEGTRISVLVDSENPGYAELPGKPSVTGDMVILEFGGPAVGFLILGVVVFALDVRVRRRTRSQQATATAGMAPAKPMRRGK